MRFFFDRCMSIRLCRMAKLLEQSKHELWHHDEDSRFTQTTKDVEWIAAVSQEPVKPVVVSGDFAILKKPDEVLELRKSGLTYFFFSEHWPDQEIYLQTWKFFKLCPEIIKQAAVAQPTVFEVRHGRSMKIEQYSRTRNVP